jgi:hypothetical protein
MIPAFDRTKNSIDYSDFTVSHYRELLRLASCNWPIVGYENIPWDSRFLLWRHDCDYSLNRAKALAQIESEEGVSATYFVNPRCEFYNLLERSQIDILHELQDMGHQIGLHFDGMFHDTHDESELVNQLQMEAGILEVTLGVRPKAFSFHNPSAFHLSCERESYAGMLNCYSKRFKGDVAYTSDSNGYWRYRRLHDVLSSAKESRLQVLTHPGWWQDEPMTSRQRVFRAVYGRADATIRFFDKAIEAGDRENPSGPRKELTFFRAIKHPDYELLDQLFHRQEYALLLLALWRLHEMQISLICKAQLLMLWEAPIVEVNDFFESSLLMVDGDKLFKIVFGVTLHESVNVDQATYSQLFNLRNELIRGRTSASQQQFESACIFLCATIESLASWGQKQSINYGGLIRLESIGIVINGTEDGDYPDNSPKKVAEIIPNSANNKWNQLKAEFHKVVVGSIK